MTDFQFFNPISEELDFVINLKIRTFQKKKFKTFKNIFSGTVISTLKHCCLMTYCLVKQVGILFENNYSTTKKLIINFKNGGNKLCHS